MEISLPPSPFLQSHKPCTFCIWLPCTCTNGYTHPALTWLHTCFHSISAITCPHITLSFGGLPVIVHMHTPCGFFLDSQQLSTFCTLIILIFWVHITLWIPHTQRDHPTRICDLLIIFPSLSGIQYSKFTQTAWWLLKILAVSFYTSRNQRVLGRKPYGSNSTGKPWKNREFVEIIQSINISHIVKMIKSGSE